jgi:LacI family transcriptional regulator
MPATLSDVARRAGVSAATASRVLNDRRYVSNSARARVEAAARELDYMPNRAARDLSTARTATIGFVVHHAQYPSSGGGTFGARVLAGASRAVRTHGFDLLYAAVDDAAVEQLPALPALRPDRSDGVLLLGPAVPARAIHALQERRRPVVLVDNRLDGDPVDAALADNAPSVEALTRHLIEVHGLRRIVCLAGPAAWPSNAERTAGYRRAMSVHGLAGRVLNARESTMRDGERSAARLADDPPDAVVAINDAMAIGVLHRLRGLGARRPAIVGFDDIAWAEMTNPPLTTVAVDAEELGARAAERLLARIASVEAGDDLAPAVLRTPGTLRIRRSCGCGKEGTEI